MLPLVDTHCHLCSGLDDGPADEETALEMCRIAWGEGTRWIAAVAHQSERWPDVTPQAIIESIGRLTHVLRQQGMPLTLCPTGEVMVTPETLQQWQDGRLLSVSNQGSYLLIEFPHGMYVDIRDLAADLIGAGVRPIVAHAERFPPLLHGGDLIDELIEIGCVIQVCADSFEPPTTRADQRALKRWFRRGIVHIVGSDGHSVTRRPPRLRIAYETISRWAGSAVADRVCSTNGLAVLQGRPLKMDKPKSPRRAWFSA